MRIELVLQPRKFGLCRVPLFNFQLVAQVEGQENIPQDYGYADYYAAYKNGQQIRIYCQVDYVDVLQGLRDLGQRKMKLTRKRMMTGTPFTAKVVKTGARATMRKKAAGTN